MEQITKVNAHNSGNLPLLRSLIVLAAVIVSLVLGGFIGYGINETAGEIIGVFVGALLGFGFGNVAAMLGLGSLLKDSDESDTEDLRSEP